MKNEARTYRFSPEKQSPYETNLTEKEAAKKGCKSTCAFGNIRNHDYIS